MPIVSLIGRSGYNAFAAAPLQRLYRALEGENLAWLAPEEAVEFEIAHWPHNAEALRAEWSGYAVDVNFLSAQDRQKPILLADMDSTMIAQECIDELAALAGVGDAVAAITARAMQGELDFEAALRARVALLAGHSVGLMDQVIEERITFAPGARRTMKHLRDCGVYTALVSGGFTDFTAYVAQELGFDQHHANRLLHENGRFTGDVADPILGRDAKVSALQAICAARGACPQDVMAVGDGANDLGMLKLAGAGVAMHAKPNVMAEARLSINHGDLTALLYLQGYRKQDF